MGFLHTNQLSKISLMPFGNMEEFRGSSVEVYQSCNPKLTGKYFGNRNRDEETPAILEIVIFGFDSKKEVNEIFIRFPNSDIYIPIIGGFGFCRGSMREGGGRNIIGEIIDPKIRKNRKGIEKQFMDYITINVHETELFLQFGYKEGEFNFLKRVAFHNLSQWDKSIKSSNNENILNEFYSRKYLKSPDFRSIGYGFITEQKDFIITDQSKYNFQYETIRCWYGNLSSMKEGKITNFARYRDGGTTTFDVLIDGITYNFFSPTPFDKDAKATWNNKEIIKLDETQIAVLLGVLQIQGIDILIEPEKVKLEEENSFYNEH